MTRHRPDYLPPPPEPQIDMAPMIDLVLLLLTFFMTSSTLITLLKDARVHLPLAEEARVPRSEPQRLIVNVYADGSLGTERGEPLSAEGLARALPMAARGGGSHLQIRADRQAAHGAVKRVLTAAREAGVQDVVFATYQTDR